jgi:hypothetical protein
MTNSQDNEQLKAAHDHSSNHRQVVEKSRVCGCFYCQETFAPETIKEWIDGGETALCPHCGIDAVIGDASEVELSAEFLEAMHYMWFEN